MEPHQLEEFALAKDRAKALELLIPGTEDHYFHSCLLLEQQGRFDEIEPLLAQWVKRHDETALVQRVRHRLALLKYEQQPKETLEHLRYELGLSFDHQRAVEGGATSHPTELKLDLTRDAVRKTGYQYSHETDLAGFTDAALEWLLDEKIDPKRVRHLLGRLKRPDYAQLPDLIALELKEPRTSGFGAIAIHGLLLKEQMDRLAKLLPALLLNDNFVNAYLLKLQPGPDADWRGDAAEREAFLTRLWDFVKPLAPKFNALKAHVLYHRLDHDRARGVYDAARFLEYAKLPRQVSYANSDYLGQYRSDTGLFDLGADFSATTLQAAIGDDEPLVRDYLTQLFRAASGIKPYDAYMATPFLNEVFASAKILAGVGDMEKWYSLLNDPGFHQALKDRVEIEFARTNPGWLRAGDPVTLAVDVKNVPALTVKVFEINALNYYLTNGRDVDTSVDLDGLVASEEKTYAYADAPHLRVRRTFDFPALSGPGVYVVELIGGGISSRALLRKGRLSFVERVGAAGHVFVVLDESRAVLKDASLWLAGREYRADAEGEIRVPFTAAPCRQPVLLRCGALTTLDAFDHRAESYAFTAGIYVDRESLLKKKEAKVLVRPTLALHGVPVALKLLEDVVLTIASTDRDGVSSTAEIAGFALTEDRESSHVFAVPDGLASISFTLRAKVQSLSDNKKLDVLDSRVFTLNGIDAGPKMEDAHLSRAAAGYSLHVLGKSGEACAGSPVNLRLRHRDLTSDYSVTLQTDKAGRIALGHLRDVSELSVSTAGGVSETWRPAADRCTRPAALHAREGESLRVPFLDAEPLGGVGVLDENGKPSKPASAPGRGDFSFLERLGATFVRDRFDALSLKDGYVEIAGLPAGDYDLLLKREGARLTVRVAPGEDRAGWIVGEKRRLERRGVRPLQLGLAAPAADALKIKVSGGGAETRVHVFAVRYAPGYSAFDGLGRAPAPSARTLETFKGPSHYVSGRDIGDEYRYILERRGAAVFPGSMMARPGLLLNPWAVRGTETAVQEAAAGSAYAPSPAPSMSAPGAPMPAKPSAAPAPGGFANLDFLAHGALVLDNLAPDAQGVVSVPRAALAPYSQLRVVAVDGLGTASRDVLLPESTAAHQDLRLLLSLDADKHFVEKKQATVLPEGRPLEIADLTTSTVELYDALSRVYRLYSTLSGDANLAAFGFILRWPQLTPAEKSAKYSEFACHELSFFVSRKDPEFFKSAVQPYLRNKKDKTFMDRYLLGDDLTSYREPWAYARLNVVERILLSQRFEDEGGPCERHVSDLLALLPRDVEGANRLFQTAIQSGALEAGDALGMADAKEKAEESLMNAAPRGALHASFGAASGASMEMRRSLSEPKMKKQAGKSAMADLASEREMSADDEGSFDESGGGGRARDAAARSEMRQFYKKLDKTQEWAENNYYRLTLDLQGPELITANAFWRDYAKHRPGAGPFLSPHAACASRNFAEMLLALSVLDLPFTADKPKVEFAGARMTLTGKTRLIAFHKEIKPAEPAAAAAPVLVSQNYFRDDDRTRYEEEGEADKYVTGEFLIDTVYACRVVLTNPTSATQKLDLLLQIPQGALPLKGGFVTKGRPVELDAYATESFEYAFYFPAPGTFPHFPVHVAKNEALIASAPPQRLNVVRELSDVDKTSWAWLSQNGEAKDVLRWLDENNIDRLGSADGIPGLDLIAWRMRDKAFYAQCLALLRKRHVYDATLWQYSVHHGDVPNIRQFLLHRDDFLNACGTFLESPLVAIDPVARGKYQHLEYAPLVNARAQKLGARRKILNNRFAEQYAALLDVLRYRPALTDADRLATAYYLLLQDRLEEGLAALESVDAKNVETQLQYDYLKTYAELLRERPDAARKFAARYTDHPVDRWRDLFRNALAQIDEIAGAAAQVVDDKDRDQRQARLAATEPDFEFSVEKNAVSVHAQNLAALTANYYRMDIELLFSRQPFVQQQSGRFDFIKPNRTDEVKLPAGAAPHSFDLPQEFRGANVIVELVGAGKRKSSAYYAHDLAVQVIENYGQVRVSKKGAAKPLAKTYVKVYARMKGGEVKFYKDGYTDLRGLFDYSSLSTNELDFVERFALLILSPSDGAVIREADAPKR